MTSATKVAAYRDSMIARKATAKGMTVPEFLAWGEREQARINRVGQLRAHPAFGRAVIGEHVTARGGVWVWEVPAAVGGQQR